MRRRMSAASPLSDEERKLVRGLAIQMLTECVQGVERYPGRLQDVSIKPLTGNDRLVLLDGAHNAQSAEVLATEVNRRRALSARGAVTWVLAFSSTKDILEILRIILRPGDKVFAVDFGPVDGMPWVEAMSSDKVVSAVQTLRSGAEPVAARVCGTDILHALELASEEARDGQLVIAGSLYLVGDVLRLLRGHETADR